MTVWIRTWQLGIKSLLLHPMRSMLTVLGIFIGVASVIWLMAIGEGISIKAQEQIESLGANNIIVRTIKPSNPGMVQAGRRSFPAYGLKRGEYSRITDMAAIVKHMPVREIRRSFARGASQCDGRLVGTTSLYTEMSHIEMERGSFISDLDNRDANTVCVLSAGVAERLFPSEDPIGKTIRIQGNENDPGFPYTVIGVTKKREATAAIGGSFSGQDFSADVYIPIQTLWVRMKDLVLIRRSGSFEGEIVELSQITLQVADRTKVKETSEIIESILRESRKGGADKEDFSVAVPLELLEQAETTRIMFNVFMGLIAAISLLVGGIGIMNIMLATVTERTREIGIRRALGAKQGDIIRQFLVETIALSVVGGAVGVLVGLSCRPVTILAMNTIKAQMPDVIKALPPMVQEIQPIIVPLSIPLAFLISVVIGVVFGLYPAYRAARMDPIEALRHE